MLQPHVERSKFFSGAGRWSIRPPARTRNFYCAILEGSCRLAVDGQPPAILEAGDFVLIPSLLDFSMSGLDASHAHGGERHPTVYPDGEVRHGKPDGPADVRLLGGLCTFRSPDTTLLAALIPQPVHIRGDRRLTMLVKLIVEESRAQRPAREPILERLLEVLLIEAFRSTPNSAGSASLLRGLADERLGTAIRLIHEQPAEAWTVAQLANAAAMSRSAFFDRFQKAVGVPPMTYLLAWRMALASSIFRKERCGIAEVAERVGYSSASTFSVAFSRHIGVSPRRHLHDLAAAPS
jgi:AraC-like DNA-binding protein